MKKTVSIENWFLIGHLISMAFGLAGILIVIPNINLILSLSEFGQVVFRWSMAGGGVVYMVLATIAVAIYAYRRLGTWHWLGFMIPAIGISLGSELLGTSTGFPFGHYHYLENLGYKIAGLVPFTIPLSWFYLGFSAYLLARVGLESKFKASWLTTTGAIALGSLLLTSWDFVLDPAMSQTSVPFWAWEQPGAFFGMPYQNFAGWFGTGVVFMTVATLIWHFKPVKLVEANLNLNLPLIMYIGNFLFAMIMSIAGGIYIPVGLGIILGLGPAIILYAIARSKQQKLIKETLEKTVTNSEVKLPISSVGIVK
jgi:putative membrane protein